jgi:hydroxymethylbilane synthase
MAAPKSDSSFIVGTRKSNLALVQTQFVADALAAASVAAGTPATFPVVHMTTVGDRNQTTPLHLLSPYNSAQPAKSLWTDELEAALLDGRMDLLVHSCKDVPTTIREGCEVAALLERHDPRDAFVVKQGLEYKSLDDLPAGAVIGTGSVRRIAQLRRAYPHLKFDDMVRVLPDAPGHGTTLGRKKWQEDVEHWNSGATSSNAC